ncbi:DUF1275 domain-containing protein [Vibrio sp. SS-MA-C1-2]|uniref:YoaK family protein n=1 Tax=Vibrio sp. SS-MA-C1-2 TaxID=2908646 RepID=UPI001F392D87|nr:YoaK family protein [Vibrio sp. SS-MA-C1-2]UJF18413.1 DUF1275 domain-containing protein [Vibrio sp. SS-MA-C1-2]
MSLIAVNVMFNLCEYNINLFYLIFIFMIKRIPNWLLFGSVLLAFTAGFINSVALLSFQHHTVSHVTGSITQAMSSIVKPGHLVNSHVLSIVGMFFLGAATSGLIIRNKVLYLDHRYSIALYLEAFILFGATYCFYKGLVSGEMLASFACGLQNAMLATYSGSILRTTHLTGIISDLGTALGQWLSRKEVKSNQVAMQLFILVAFSVGALLASELLTIYGPLVMLIPAILVSFIATLYMATLNYKLKA